MPIMDLVKWDGNPTLLAWKFPSQELSTWTQLVVNESQEAFVVRGGVYDGPFGGGRHVLETENLPLLRGSMGLPFGGKSPFTAEVWFVNRVTNLSIPWGTPDPIQLQDPKYDVMLPVRAFGQYGVQVSDSKKFLLKLVGTLRAFDVTAMKSYFDGVLTARIKQAIATAIIDRKISVLETNMHIEELSNALLSALSKDFEEYGIRLTQFNIRSINVPENDSAVMSLKSALAKKAQLGILGMSYQQDRSFNVLQTAAGNEGAAGGIIGAGVGLGVGLGVGNGFAQSMSSVTNVMTPEASGSTTPSDMNERLRQLKEAGELRASGVLDEESFVLLRNQILGVSNE